MSTTWTLYAASRCFDTIGAAHARDLRDAWDPVTAGKARLLGKLLSQTVRDGVLCAGFEQEDFRAFGASRADMAGLANQALAVDGVLAVVTATPDSLDGDPGCRRVSVRTSPYAQRTAQEVAARFGGGGRPCAAGCSVPVSDACSAMEAAARVAAFCC